MKHAVQCLLSVTCVVSLLSLLSSCGSGGGDGVPPLVSTTTTQTIVSGTVQAPGGQVAFFKKNSFSDLFVSDAYAALVGLANVSDNTIVQLARLNTNASDFSVLATTTTSSGRYSFNLTTLGLQPANDLIVRVAGASGEEMRAFVVGTVADLSPVSEATHQLAVQSLNGGPINNLTLQEVSDISGAVGLIGTLQNLGAATSINQAVGLVKAAVGTNAQLTGFLAAVAANGQTAQGPGDVGNLFPFGQGNVWEYKKTRSNSGSTSQPYTNTHSVSGTKSINGVDTTILRETNPENNGIPEEEYVLKTAAGIFVHGTDPASVIVPQIVPYQAIRFPLSVFGKFVSLNKERITISDLPVDLTIEVNVLGFESVTVPSGTYANALKVVTNQVATLAGDSTQTVTGTQTVWLVSNLGIVKSMLTVTDSGDTTQTDVEELVRATIDGVEHTFGAQVRTVALAANDLIYDPITDRIYASTPGNPGSITVVNPRTGSIGPSIAVGNQPNKLALSSDGLELYVALDGDAAIRHVDLSTFSAQERLLLGSNPIPGCGSLLVSDMEILPENAKVVIVSKKHAGCTPGFVEVAVYENGTQKPNVIPRVLPGGVNSVRIDYLEPAFSPATVFGASTSGPDNFFVVAVDSGGLSLAHRSQVLSLGTGADIETDSGMVFTGLGQKFDPIAKTILGEVQGLSSIFTAHTTRVRPDLSSHRLFFLPSEVSSGIPIMLLVYDSSTLQHLGTSQVHGGISGCSGCTFSVRGFIRWGARGLAFTTSNGQITLVESSFIP